VHEFTVGQRRGLGVAAAEARYVIELRPRENQVVVGDQADADASALDCSRLSFTGRRPEGAFSAGIKVRYRTPQRPGTVQAAGDRAEVTFARPIWGVAPGQLAVFYDGDRVIGGGTIDRAIRASGPAESRSPAPLASN
ncbi:MAG: tRNA 2-thiouridine(34) synthase MnmA, partial [Chloroflexota bacterium]|nr:tRNA 2-thiouridine(34) synthase MnmA [Chloroflexota bacterium]